MNNKERLPHSHEAEEALIGALLINDKIIDEVKVNIVPDDFYFNIHRYIYMAILFLHESETPIDPITVFNELKKRGGIKIETLYEISNGTPCVDNYMAYSDIVREKSILRTLIKLANEIVLDCCIGSKSSIQMLEEAEFKMKEIEKRS